MAEVQAKDNGGKEKGTEACRRKIENNPFF